MTDLTTPTTDVPRRKRKKQLGQSIVEFALVLPMFMIVVLGIIDFGWALRCYIVTTNAAREGARYGVTGVNQTLITQRTVERSANLLTASNVSVTGAQGAPGTSVSVKVDYYHNYITPLGRLMSAVTGGTLSNPLKMTSETTMRLE
jgi:Flp pilus assembly protein TadG